MTTERERVIAEIMREDCPGSTETQILATARRIADRLASEQQEARPTDADMVKALEWVRSGDTYFNVRDDILVAIERAILAFDPERAGVVNELIEANKEYDAAHEACAEAAGKGGNLPSLFGWHESVPVAIDRMQKATVRRATALARLQGAKP